MKDEQPNIDIQVKDEQLNIDMPIINERLTKENVIKAFRKYRMCLLGVNDEYLPKITPSYSLEPVSTVSEYNGSTERIIEVLDRSLDYMRWIEEAVNRLPADDRAILYEKFMGRQEVSDYQVWSKLCMSSKHFERKKKEAMINFGVALEIAEYTL